MAVASRTRRINIYINGQQVTNDLKSITAAFNKLRNETRLLNMNSKEYHANVAKMKQLKSIIADHNAQLSQTAINFTSLKGLANAFNKYWPLVMGSIGMFAGMIFGIKRTAEVFAEFDDKVSDVMKTTKLSREEVLALNEAFKQMDTRTAKNELLELAWVAGKLGITAQEEILGFVRAANVISVALKKDLGGSAEEAITILGKLVNVFGLKDELGIEQALIKTASSINELGMATEANEKNIVNFSRRVGGVANISNVSIPDILGLAAAVDALALSTEVAGTAYSMFMTRMVKDTATFANIAGMKLEDFNKLIEEDANEAMLIVLEAIGQNEGGFRALALALGDAGMEGQRATGIFSNLAKQTDLIRQQQELSNLAFEMGTSVINEYNIKNNNSKAILEKLAKDLKNYREELGEKLIPAYIKGNEVAVRFVKTLSILIDFFSRHGAKIAAVVVTYLAYLTAIRLINLGIKIKMGLMLAYNRSVMLASVAHAMLTGNLIRVNTQMKLFSAQITSPTLRWAILLLSKYYWQLTGQIELANKAQRALNMSARANPWIAIVSAIAAVTVALIAYRKLKKDVSHIQKLHNELSIETSKNLEKEVSGLNRLFTQLQYTNPQSANRKRIIEEMQRLYPDYISNIDLEKASVEDLTKAQEESLEVIRKRVELGILDNKMMELLDEKAKIQAKNFKSTKDYQRLFQIDIELNIIDDKLKMNELSQNFDKETAELIKTTENLYQKLNDARQRATQSWVENEDGTWEIVSNEAYIAALEAEIKFNEKRLELRKKALKEQEDLEGHKVIYNDMWFNEQRRKLQEDFLEGRIATYKEYDEKLLDLQIEYLEKRVEHENLDDEEKLRAQNDLFTALRRKYEDKGKSLNDIDLWFYHEQHKLRQAFIKGDIESIERYNQLVFNLEVEKYQRIIRSQESSEQEKLRAQERLDDMFVKQREEHLKRLADLDKAAQTGDPVAMERQRFTEQVVSLGLAVEGPLTAEGMAAYAALYRDHLDRINKIDADAIKSHFDKRQKDFELELSLMKLNHAEQLDAVRDNAQEHARLKKEFAEKERQFSMEHYKTLLEDLAFLMEGFSLEGINLADKILSEEEREELLNFLRLFREEMAKLKGSDPDKDPKRTPDFTDTLYRGTDILGFTADDWLSFFDNLENTEYQVERIAFGVQALTDAYAQYAAFMARIEERDMRRKQAKADQEKESLRRQLEFNLISQENYNAKVRKIEDELDHKRAVIARKQAIREKAVATMGSIVNTALSVTKMLASGNLALAILVGLLGAAQTALIVSTPLPDLPGAEEGGQLVKRLQDGKKFRASIQPGKRGFVHTPTVLTGEDGTEYIVPAEGVKNTDVKLLLDGMERARLDGTLGTITINDLIGPAIMQGRQQGGYVSQPTPVPTPPQVVTDPELKQLLKQHIDATEKLNRKLDKPFRSVVTLYGEQGLYKAMERDEIIKYNANL